LSPAGEEIAIVNRKGRILLAYLAMQAAQSATRETLAHLLWDNVDRQHARSCLRQTLTRVRKLLARSELDVLDVTADTVALHENQVVVDARWFERGISQGTEQALKAAVECYHGAFLAGIACDSGAAEEWIESTGRRLHWLACDGLWRLASQALAARQWAEAIDYAHRLVAFDSLREDAFRILIEAYAEAGNTSAALRHYFRCVDVLRRQLGVAPEAETQRLFGWLRARRQGRDAPAVHTPAMPSKHCTIVVLPFNTTDGEPELRRIADGIAEDITTDLSRYSGLIVATTSGQFATKGGMADIRLISMEKGARFVLTGHVRGLGSKARLTMRLIDAKAGSYLWAERFDLAPEEVVGVQDDITARVVSALGDAVNLAALYEIRRMNPADRTPYEKCLQASAQIIEPNQIRYAEARRLVREVIAEDDRFAQAYPLIAFIDLVTFTSRWPESADHMLHTSYEAARRAVELDHNDASGHTVLGVCQTWHHQHDLAIGSFERAVTLNPINADTRARFANTLVFAGEADQALHQIDVAMRLNPASPATYLHFKGRAYFAQRRYADAEYAFAKAATLAPSWPWARLMLAAARVVQGKVDVAKSEVTAAMTASPALKSATVTEVWPVRDTAKLDQLQEALRQAGLPE
jgi:TolB-like protein